MKQSVQIKLVSSTCGIWIHVNFLSYTKPPIRKKRNILKSFSFQLTLIMFSSSYLFSSLWYVQLFPLKVYASSKPLRIGYYESDGFSQPTPSMKRAIQQTKQLLEKAGHEVINFLWLWTKEKSQLKCGLFNYPLIMPLLISYANL